MKTRTSVSYSELNAIEQCWHPLRTRLKALDPDLPQRRTQEASTLAEAALRDVVGTQEYRRVIYNVMEKTTWVDRRPI